jgi:hypothetical protein
MAMYRKKPVEREAKQWSGLPASSIKIQDWMLEHQPDALHPKNPFKLDSCEPPHHAEIWVAANKDWLTIHPGDWVIMDSEGFYPCLESVFADTYEPVAEEVPVTGEDGFHFRYIEIDTILQGQPNSLDDHHTDECIVCERNALLDLAGTLINLPEDMDREMRNAVLRRTLQGMEQHRG